MMKGSQTNRILIETIAGISGLLLLCSCATHPSARPERPADTSMNTAAGYGNHLVLRLHMENGKKLRFLVDTGSPWTVLDKSLEPELGKRTGKRHLNYAWYPNAYGNTYQSPTLYLGDTRLMLGDSVTTDDLQQKCGTDGILGMDCLRHYCIQLDFAGQSVRFLDPDEIQVEELGQPFPLSYVWWNLSTRMNFYGKDRWFRIDTGDGSDGTLKSSLLKLLQKAEAPAEAIETGTDSRGSFSEFRLAPLVLAGNSYTNLVVHKRSNGPNDSILGLQFLARHLVTLNFPKGTMYLKQTSVGPLVDERFTSVFPVVKNLIEKDQLPGLSRQDKGRLSVYLTPNRDVIIFTFHMAGDPANRYYQISRIPESDNWKLEKAWRADEHDKIIEEYPVP